MVLLYLLKKDPAPPGSCQARQRFFVHNTPSLRDTPETLPPL